MYGSINTELLKKATESSQKTFRDRLNDAGMELVMTKDQGKDYINFSGTGRETSIKIKKFGSNILWAKTESRSEIPIDAREDAYKVRHRPARSRDGRVQSH